MWPRCRGRRLPVKLTTGETVIPATPAADAGTSDSAPGNALDYSMQAIADTNRLLSNEARVQAAAPLSQSNKICGCSRKPCCCLPETESTPASRKEPTDQLRPTSYLPRDALFRMRGGRKVRLMPIPASRGRGEPQEPSEQTWILPPSQHRRLNLKDTAVEGQESTAVEQSNRAEDTTSTEWAAQHADNPPHQVTGPLYQTPAGEKTPMQCIHTATEEVAHVNRQPERLYGQQNQLSVKPVTPEHATHSTAEGLWNEDRHPQQFIGLHEPMLAMSERLLQEAPHGDHCPVTLNSQQQLLPSRPAAPNPDISIQMQNAQHDDLSPERLSGQQRLLPSRPATSNDDRHIRIQEASRDDFSPESLSGRQGLLPSRPATSNQGIHIQIQENPFHAFIPVRLSVQQEPLTSVPGMSNHRTHIPVQEASIVDQNRDRLNPKQDLLSSRIGISEHGIHIPIQDAPHSDRLPEGLSGQQEPLSSRPGTSKHGIRIVIQEAPNGDRHPERLTGQQKPLSSILRTYKPGIYIPIHVVPHSAQHVGQLTDQQAPIQETYPPQEEALYQDRVPNHIGANHNQVSTRPASHLAGEVESFQDNVANGDTRNQVSEGPGSHLQQIPPVMEEQPVQGHRSWIFGFLLDQIFGRQKPSTETLQPTTVEICQGDNPAVYHHGQQQVMPTTPAHETLTEEQGHMAREPDGSIQGIHSSMEGTQSEVDRPEHVIETQNQVLSRPDGHIQGIPSTTDNERQQDHRSGIFKFLQNRFFGRKKESTQRIHPTRSESLQGDHPPDEGSSDQQQQVTATPIESRVDNHQVTMVETSTDHCPEPIVCPLEQMPAGPETTTEYIHHATGPVQGIHAAMEEVLHEERIPGELNIQQEQLPARPQTTQQDMQPTIEDATHDEE